MRGMLKKRYKGSWSVVIDTKDPETGERKRKWVTVKGNKEAAETKLTELLRSLDTNTYVDASKLTLGEWLATWLELAQSDKREKPLRPTTVSRYQSILDVRLLKSPLAALPLQKITTADIERYYAAQKVSTATLALDHAILHNALKRAKTNKYIVTNPVEDVEHRPRANRAKKSDEAKIHAWSASEAARFLTAAKQAGPQPGAFYALALDSGMRKSELGGLLWTNVDFDAGTVTVAGQLTKTGPKPEWGPTKTGSTRVIDIAPGTITLLREHRRMQAELKMKNRATYADHGLVFAKDWNDVRRHGETLGQPLQLNNIGQREFDRLIRAARVPRIKFHGLRHTSATLLLNSGEPVHNVSKRLGHSKVTMTMEVYAHLLGESGKQMAATMGALLHG